MMRLARGVFIGIGFLALIVMPEGGVMAAQSGEPPLGSVTIHPLLVAQSYASFTEEGAEVIPDEEGNGEPEKRGVLESLDFSGSVVSKLATDLNKNNDIEDLLDFRNHLKLEAKAEVNESVKFFASYQIKYLLSKNGDTDDDLDTDLWEAYLDCTFGNWDVRIGQQIVRWGKTDELSPVDNINPQEFEEFVLPKLDKRKLPLLLAKVRYFIKGYTLEGVFIPFFKRSHITFFDSDWGAFDHLKEAVERPTIPPAIRDLVRSARLSYDEPPNNLKNSSFGFRVSKTLEGVDVALSYLYSRNPLPTVESAVYRGEGLRGISSLSQFFKILRRVDLTQVRSADLALRYRRVNVWGAEMETTWGDVGIRGEVAYFHRLSFADDELSKVNKDLVHYVLGADYTWGENLYINLQFSQQIVLNYEDLFYQERVTNAFNGTVNKEFMQGFLIPEVYFYWNTTDGDFYLNPSVKYKWADSVSVSVGLYILGGDRDTLIGNYKDNDELYCAVEYTF